MLIDSLNDHVLKETIYAHGISEYPNEACGFVFEEKGSLVYVPQENISEVPKEEFVIDPRNWPQGKNLVALVHSHPNSQNGVAPSKTDMEGQLTTGTNWGIYAIDTDTDTGELKLSDFNYWGPDIEIPPLIGRPFRVGPSGSDGKGDCYAIVKDYYKLKKGIDLLEFPRTDDWWKTGGDMYRQGFAKTGFRQINETEVRDGDVFLAQILSDVPNHGGIYLDNDEDGHGACLHHLQGQLSRRDNLSVYKRFITHYLRHNDA